MDRILEKNIKLYSILLIFLGVFLNHSTLLFNVNISYADFFVAFIFMLLVLYKKLKIPKEIIIFFILIMISTLVSAIWSNYYIFGHNTSISSIIIGMVKQLIVIFYFIVGFNLLREKEVGIVYKSFAYCAICIGIIAIIYSIVEINFLSERLYFAHTRFRGFMNDPNYFAIVQNIAIVYFYFDRRIKKQSRLFAIIILLISILLSGSKTGLITFALIFFLYLIKEKYIFRNVELLLKMLLIISVITIIFLVFGQKLFLIYQNIANDIPAIERISKIFTDFSSAIYEDGSNRAISMEKGIGIFTKSPIFGVGIGSYSDIAYELYSNIIIAHNTYIQLFVEWGIPISLIFFVYIFRNLIFSYRISDFNNKKIIYAMFVLLVSSASISLNNSRQIWFFLGLVVSTSKY